MRMPLSASGADARVADPLALREPGWVRCVSRPTSSAHRREPNGPARPCTSRLARTCAGWEACAFAGLTTGRQARSLCVLGDAGALIGQHPRGRSEYRRHRGDRTFVAERRVSVQQSTDVALLARFYRVLRDLGPDRSASRRLTYREHPRCCSTSAERREREFRGDLRGFLKRRRHGCTS